MLITKKNMATAFHVWRDRCRPPGGWQCTGSLKEEAIKRNRIKRANRPKPIRFTPKAGHFVFPPITEPQGLTGAAAVAGHSGAAAAGPLRPCVSGPTA